MKSILNLKLSEAKNLSLLALLLFTNSLIFAQEKNREEKGSKHIKIEAEIDGKTIEIDTIIPAGAVFDHAAFLKSVGLEDEIQMDFDDDSFDSAQHDIMSIDTKDGTSIRKEIRVEIEENHDVDEESHKMMTKTIMIMDDNEIEDLNIIKTINEDGKEEIQIIRNGEVIDGDDKMIIKKIYSDEDEDVNDAVRKKKVKIMTDKDESIKDFDKSSEMKYWVDKDGKKHKIKEGDRVIIIKGDK